MLNDRREFAKTCKHVLGGRIEEFPESADWLNAMSKRLDEEAFRSVARLSTPEITYGVAPGQFAKEISPTRRRSGIWWRLEAKMVLSQDLWRAMRDALNRLRDIRKTPLDGAHDILSARMAALRTGNCWWPDRA